MDFSRDGKKKAPMPFLIPMWAQALEPVRNLPTDGGYPILKCICEALQKNPPRFAKTILEHAMSKKVYKANDSELTKFMVIILLAYAVIENKPGKRKDDTGKRKDDTGKRKDDMLKRKDDMVKRRTNGRRIEEPQDMMVDKESEQLITEANISQSKEEENVSKMVEIVSDDPCVNTSVEHMREMERFIYGYPNIPEWPHVGVSLRELETNPVLENNPANNMEMLEYSVGSGNMVEANPEVSTGPTTELDLLKAQERALQEEISSFNDKKDEMIRRAKKEAVEAYKNSDEFYQDLINAKP